MSLQDFICNEIRHQIFKEYYDIKTEELRWNFIARPVRRIPKKRSYVTQNYGSRRQNTLVYSLTAGHTEHQVCQKFFLNTLQSSSKKVLTYLLTNQTKEARKHHRKKSLKKQT